MSVWGTVVGMLLAYYGWVPRDAPWPVRISALDMIFSLVTAMLLISTWFSLSEFREFRRLHLAGRISALCLPLTALILAWKFLPLVPQAGFVTGYDMTVVAIAALAVSPAIPQIALCRLFDHPESRLSLWLYRTTLYAVAILAFMVLTVVMGRMAGYGVLFLFSLLLALGTPRNMLSRVGWIYALTLSLLQVELYWGMEMAHIPAAIVGAALGAFFVLLSVVFHGPDTRIAACDGSPSRD